MMPHFWRIIFAHWVMTKIFCTDGVLAEGLSSTV